MIQQNLQEVDAEDVSSLSAIDALSASMAKAEQDKITALFKLVLPEDHPWFKITGNKSAGGQPSNREHILSPGIRHLRNDVTEEQMQAAREIKLDYSPESGLLRRAKAEAMRRDSTLWPFRPAGLGSEEEYDWHWKNRLCN